MRTILIALMAISIATPTLSQTRNSSETFFPVAVWYGGGKARAPMLELDPGAQRDAWRADLRQIKSLGFNAVRCWIDWATAEPREGQYNFANLDQLLELAESVGLKVIVQVYIDSAPDWVGKKFPDSHFVSISGDVMPSHAAPGYCFDHPGVRKAVLGFFTALAERVKPRAAFHGWDLWSEPHVINWAQATYMPSAEFCFCPYTVARFRGWLGDKYGTLDALNRAWYRRFESWDEVGPNRLGTILSYTDYIDWRFFIQSKLQSDLKARYDAVKSVLPDKVATSHAASPGLFTSPLGGDGVPDDWKMADVVDYWGTSFYPKHSMPVGRDVPWRAGLLDFSRSASDGKANGFWVGELQGGFGTIALRVSATVTPNDLSVWMWSALSRGAKAISVYAWYPMSSGYESGGFGLIHLDGTITERARVAGAIAKVVDSNQRLFLDARPLRADVAIVYNPLAYMVGGRRPLQVAGAQGEFAAIERNSMLGIYRALFPSNVPVDFVHVDEIARGGGSRYKLIYLPYPLMLSEATAQKLLQFVRDGGTLVSEARLAWNDEKGRAKEIIPGFGFHEACSCRETAVQNTVSGKTEMEIVAEDPSIPLLKKGDKVRGAGYEETLTPISNRARVIAKFANGDPAIVASNYGKGKMLALGTFLGTLYETDRDENAAKLLSGVLGWAGIAPPIAMTGAKDVELRAMESGRDLLLFLFNHGSEPAEPDIQLKGDVVDLVTGKPAALKSVILPTEVRVLRVKR